MSARAIHKASIPVDDHWHRVDIGRIVHVDCQRSPHDVEIWYEVDDARPVERREFRVYGTGHWIDPLTDHVGTVVLEMGLVWHLRSRRFQPERAK